MLVERTKAFERAKECERMSESDQLHDEIRSLIMTYGRVERALKYNQLRMDAWRDVMGKIDVLNIALTAWLDALNEDVL